MNTGDTFRSYVLAVMSRTRYPCATPVKICSSSIVAWAVRVTLIVRIELTTLDRKSISTAELYQRHASFCKSGKWWLPARWFEHLTSGLWAPRAHRCATSVRVCSSALMHHCDVMINTGGTFRSYDLEVMSPARCLCATPVKVALV